MKPIKIINEGKPSGKPKKEGGKPGGGNCKSMDEAYTDLGYEIVDVTTWRSSSDTEYDKKWKLCTEDRKNHYYRKLKETPAPDGNTPAPGPISSKYQDCTGKKIRFNGCKDTDGIINRVQGCLGVKQDNFFGPKTEEQLKLKTGKEYFTTDQVDAICSGKLTPDGESGAGTTTFSWDTLIENEQIYNSGLKYKIKDGTEVYIIKRELDTDKKLPLDTLSGADPEKFDYFVYFPIPQGQTRGNYGKLIFYTTPNGERKVKVDKNQNWKWEAEENIESFDVMEGSIKKLLNNILSEQKHYGGPADRRSSDQSGGSPSTSQTSGVQQTGGSGVTNVKPNPNDVKKVIEPIRLETIGLLNQIKENPKFKIAASAEDIKNLDDAITLLKNFDSSKACDNITLIDENLTFLNQMIKANEGGFGKKDIVYLAKQVRTNLEKVKSECQRLENEAVSKSKISQQQVTQPNTMTGTQTTTQPNQQGSVTTTSQTNQTTQQNKMTGSEEPIQEFNLSRDECRNKIKELHLAAFPPRLRADESDIKDIPLAKKEIIWCAREYPFGKVFGAKDELQELIKCRTEKNRKLQKGRNEYCLYDVKNQIELKTESIVSNQVNNLLTEKRNNKSKISSLISEAVVAKRKEKTRDVIAEDLIRMIKGY
jgi:hypothetical protein